MKRKSGIAIILLLLDLALFCPQAAKACSAFVMEAGGRFLFGRNYDFFTGTGFVMVNPRSLEKAALVPPGEAPARWVSTFGSVTFNQVAREFPMGGMNEKGLVVECLWLAETQYPSPDGRSAITELQWIQYVLDTCQTVREVLSVDGKVRILPSATRLHFLVCDRTGEMAVVEFIGGKQVAWGPDNIPVKALANAPFGESLQALKQFRKFGGVQEIPAGVQSNNERFARMAVHLRDTQPCGELDLLDRAFNLLHLSQYDGTESPTQWSIVYDPARLELRYQTRQNINRQTIIMESFNFDCTSPALARSLDPLPGGGPAVGFSAFNPQEHADYVRQTMASMKKAGYAKDVPDFAIFILGVYPQTLTCNLVQRAASSGSGH